MKISIIGAGPVGCHVGCMLAKKGFNVDIYEDHETIGQPIQCTGLLTGSLNEVIRPEKEFITNTTENVEIISPDGNKLLIRSKEFIVHRTKFDQHMAGRAVDEGAVIHTGHRFLKKENGSLLLKDKNENKIKKIKNDFLIGADGANSTVAKLLNQNRARKYCVGIQARVAGDFDPKTYTVHFDNRISPGFFAWIVPEDCNFARVGLKGTSANFEHFLKKKEFKKIEMQAGPIPVYDPAYKTEKGQICLVGDAATQVKATTAGGIIPGLKAAECLAQAIEEGCSYEKLWKKRIGRDLWLHLKIRQVLDNFSDKDWNRLISYISQERVKKIFERYDREKPFNLLTAVAKEPRILWFARYFL